MISVFKSDKKTDNFSEIGLPVFHDISTLCVFLCPETPNNDVRGLLKVDPETLNSFVNDILSLENGYG